MRQTNLEGSKNVATVVVVDPEGRIPEKGRGGRRGPVDGGRGDLRGDEGREEAAHDEEGEQAELLAHLGAEEAAGLEADDLERGQEEQLLVLLGDLGDFGVDDVAVGGGGVGGDGGDGGGGLFFVLLLVPRGGAGGHRDQGVRVGVKRRRRGRGHIAN